MNNSVDLLGLIAPGERPFAWSDEGRIGVLQVGIDDDVGPWRSVITLVNFHEARTDTGAFVPA